MKQIYVWIIVTFFISGCVPVYSSVNNVHVNDLHIHNQQLQVLLKHNSGSEFILGLLIGGHPLWGANNIKHENLGITWPDKALNNAATRPLSVKQIPSFDHSSLYWITDGYLIKDYSNKGCQITYMDEKIKIAELEEGNQATEGLPTQCLIFSPDRLYFMHRYTVYSSATRKAIRTIDEKQFLKALQVHFAAPVTSDDFTLTLSNDGQRLLISKSCNCDKVTSSLAHILNLVTGEITTVDHPADPDLYKVLKISEKDGLFYFLLEVKNRSAKEHAGNLSLYRSNGELTAFPPIYRRCEGEYYCDSWQREEADKNSIFKMNALDYLHLGESYWDVTGERLLMVERLGFSSGESNKLLLTVFDYGNQMEFSRELKIR